MLLSGDRSVIYFITICVKGRRYVLDNEPTWQRTTHTLEKLHRWSFIAVVQMPDHVHLLAAPLVNRDEAVADLLMWFKRWFHDGRNYDWQWQDGGFDRLLRCDEFVDQKWDYMRTNPVRAGLVNDPDDWPYRFIDPRWL